MKKKKLKKIKRIQKEKDETNTMLIPMRGGVKAASYFFVRLNDM